MSDKDDGILSRWSRRKRGIEVEKPIPAEPDLTPAPDDPVPEAVEDLDDSELLEKLGLPDPDTLVDGDDFKAFMARNVPQHLRNRALRRLWGSNPVLANLDGLLDHGEDYTDAATVPEVLKTAYKVGKGFLHVTTEEEPPAEMTAEAEAAPETPQPEQEPQDAPPETATTELQPEDPPAPRPRRMDFRKS